MGSGRDAGSRRVRRVGLVAVPVTLLWWLWWGLVLASVIWLVAGGVAWFADWLAGVPPILRDGDDWRGDE